MRESRPEVRTEVCPACGKPIIRTTRRRRFGAPIRYTLHQTPGSDPAVRCIYDRGRDREGSPRETFPGDTPSQPQKVPRETP